MNTVLFNKYNALKEEFIKSIDEIVESKGGTIQICVEYYTLISDSTDTEMITITMISRNDDDIICHLYATDTETLEVIESWTPLRDLSIDELYKIAEKL